MIKVYIYLCKSTVVEQTPSIPVQTPQPYNPPQDNIVEPPQPKVVEQPVVLQPISSISKQEAIALINNWQSAKKYLFAPPFNRQLGAELTTGEAYRKNIGSTSSLQWLIDNNAYSGLDTARGLG